MKKMMTGLICILVLVMTIAVPVKAAKNDNVEFVFDSLSGEKVSTIAENNDCKVIVIMFGNSTCAPCEGLIGNVTSAKWSKSKDVKVIYCILDNNVDTLKKYQNAYGNAINYCYGDEAWEAFRYYYEFYEATGKGRYSIPLAVVINPKSNEVVDAATGVCCDIEDSINKFYKLSEKDRFKKKYNYDDNGMECVGGICTVGDYKFTINKDGKTIELIEYTGKETQINIPSRLFGGNYRVTSIGKGMFKNNTRIRKVKLPAGVTVIKANAFKGCRNLKSVNLPANIKRVDKGAFNGCKKLKKLTIKTTKLNNKNVGSKAFKDIGSNVKVQLPKKKYKEYKKLLISKGLSKESEFVKE